MIVIYDILRDGIGVAPIVMIAGWLGGAALVIGCIVGPSRKARRQSRLGPAVWLVVWLTLGGIGFGNVLRQHFRCRAAAASGNVQVVEGSVTAYHPEDRFKNGDQEILTVAGQTWTYDSANLGGGGYRGRPSATGLIRVGSRVRISSYDGRIVKLEVMVDGQSPAASSANAVERAGG